MLATQILGLSRKRHESQPHINVRNQTYRRKVFLMACTLVLIALFALITHNAISSLVFGLLSGTLLSAGFSDIRTGEISNSVIIVATLLAIALNMFTGGPVVALVRISFVVLIWGIFATARFAKNSAGGGDLKMMGVTWLVLAAFPFPLALILMIPWALIFAVVLAVMRLRDVHRLRAGLALATAAILTWMIGLGILA